VYDAPTVDVDVSPFHSLPPSNGGLEKPPLVGESTLRGTRSKIGVCDIENVDKIIYQHCLSLGSVSIDLTGTSPRKKQTPLYFCTSKRIRRKEMNNTRIIGNLRSVKARPIGPCIYHRTYIHTYIYSYIHLWYIAFSLPCKTCRSFWWRSRATFTVTGLSRASLTVSGALYASLCAWHRVFAVPRAE
jgi:hypothetical protein